MLKSKKIFTFFLNDILQKMQKKKYFKNNFKIAAVPLHKNKLQFVTKILLSMLTIVYTSK